MEITKTLKDFNNKGLQNAIAELLFNDENVIAKGLYNTDTNSLMNDFYYIIPQEKITITISDSNDLAKEFGDDEYYPFAISYTCTDINRYNIYLDNMTRDFVIQEFEKLGEDIYFNIEPYEIRDYDSIDSLARKFATKEFGKTTNFDISIDHYFRTAFTINNKKYLIARDSNFKKIHLTEITKGAEQ